MTARITYVLMPLLILPIFCPSRVFAAPADEMGVFILESIETEENEMELETVDMFWADEIEIAEESGEVYDEVPGEDVYDTETSEVGSEMMPFLLEIEDDSDLASENAPVETDAFPELVLSGFEETEALLNASSSVVDSGMIGGSVSWELTGKPSSLTLTVRGEGALKGQPWRDYRDQIVKVVIEDGITGIGQEAFYFCTKLKDITIPDSVRYIENRVFYE